MPIADDFIVEDFIVKSANDLFTDREEPRKAFWDIYNSMRPGEYTSIAYYGIGGIGKSTLLKKLAEEIDERVQKGSEIDHIIYSFETEQCKEKFLFHLSRQMMLCCKGLSFPVFDEAITKIYEDSGRDIEQLKIETKASLLKNPLFDFTFSIVSDFIPFGGTTTKMVENIITLSNTKIDEYEHKHGKNAILYNQIMYSDYKELVRDLQKYFIYDVREVMKKRTRPLVIFLDAYEKYVDIINDFELAASRDNWIHSGMYRLVNIPNTFWVVAGREKIHWEKDVLPEENQHRIGDLSEKDSKDYFERAGIKNNPLVLSHLCKLCAGTPVYMDLCVKTYHEISRKRQPVIEDFGKDTSEMARRYLDCMDRDTRRIMELIAWLPNVWTTSMVEDVAKRINYESYLPQLEVILRLSLVEPIGIGYKLHQVCRVAAKDISKETVIPKAVMEYLKEEIFGVNGKEDKWQMIDALMEVICFSENLGLSEIELRQILEIYKNLKKYSANYYETFKLIEKIDNYVKKENFPAGIKVWSATLKIDNIVDLGRFKEAIELAKINYLYAENNLAEDSLEFLEILRCMAYCYGCLGNYLKKRTLITRYNEVCERVFGEEHPNTLNSLVYLASSFVELGDYATAKDLYEKCYEIRKRVLGEGHPDTLSNLNSLASTYSLLGTYSKAKELAEKCYEIRICALGEKHPNTLISLSVVANIYHLLGNLEKAKELKEKCYEDFKRILGEEHPTTLSTLNNLVVSYSALGDYKKAKDACEKCYIIDVRTLGEEHPNTQRCCSELASIYGSLGDYEVSKELREKNYEISKRVLGEEHPTTLTILNNLVVCYANLGTYSKAKELAEKCYEARKRVLGEEHPSTLSSLNVLASMHNLLGDYANSKELKEKCYEIRRRVLGEEHPDTLKILNNLSRSYASLGNYSKAKELDEKCYEARKRVLGVDHPDTLHSLHNMALNYSSLGDYEKAKELEERCYEARKRVLGEKHPGTLKSLKNLIHLLRASGDLIKAEEIEKQYLVS